jgi:hypothetical protein
MTINNQTIDLDARQILLKRGNLTVNNSYIGPIGEITLDTTLLTLRVHNGVTPGGVIIPTEPTTRTWITSYLEGNLGPIVAATVANTTSTVTGLIANVSANVSALAANVSASLTQLVGNASPGLNTLGEISVSLDNDPALAANLKTLITAVQSNLNSEVARAFAAETVLQTNINNEANARIASDISLQSNITAEANARIAADANLQVQINNILSNFDASILDSFTEVVSTVTSINSNVTAEANARIAADADLQSNITAESNARTTAINNEINIRAAADTALQGNITAEANARVAADTTLQSNINTEALIREADDTRLQVSIAIEEGARIIAVNNEANARIAADTTLQSNITAEVNRATAAELALQSNITSEVNARTLAVSNEANARALADTSLQSNITALDNSLATVAKSGSYPDLINRPNFNAFNANIIPDTDNTRFLGNSTHRWHSILVGPGSITIGNIVISESPSGKATLTAPLDLSSSDISWANVTGKPNFANVSTSGAYADLSGVPTNLNQFTNGPNFANVAYVNTAVSNEANLRSTATSNLQSQINNILNNSDPAALDSLSEIVTAFQSADGNLLSALSNISSTSGSNLTAEINRATAAEANLQANISSEITARIQAVSNEANARVLADSNLQSNINSLTNSLANVAFTGLVDIVDTNGLTTVFYPVFVEQRSEGQYIRADVDLNYTSDTNTLTTSNITASDTVVTGTLIVGTGIQAINASPAPSISGFSSISAVNLIGNGGNISNIQIGNISGIGNIASINLDGNSANALLGNGTWGPVDAGIPNRIENGTKTVILGSDGTLTLPPQSAMLANVNQIATAKIYRATNSTNATAIQEAKDAWFGNETLWEVVRDEDAGAISPQTRPWAGMPSWEAYPLIMSYTPPGGVLPAPSNFPPIAKTAQDSYLLWKELVSNIDIVSGDKTFSFENTGNLRVPGVVTSDDLLTLISSGTTTFNSASVVADGDNGNVFVKTRDGITLEDKTWNFGIDGNLTFPDNTVQTTAWTGSTTVSSLINSTETFTLSETGDVTFSGQTGGINRGIVWDYGAVAGGVNSSIRQDGDGLTVRAYTETSGNYAAPVRILTNQGANEQIWQFDDTGNLTIPGDIKALGTIIGDGADLTVQAGETITGEGGDLTIKTGTSVTGNAGVLSIRAGDTTTGNGGNLNVKAGDAVTGDGGSFDVRAGDTITGNGGNITITAGSTINEGPGGSVTIASGNNIWNAAGNINLVAGTSTTSVNGAIRLSAVGGSVVLNDSGLSLGGVDSYVQIPADNNSPVYITANNNVWTFGNTGTTQFPGSKILAPVSESITMQSDQYSQLMWENANLTVAPNMAINSNFYVAQNNATLDIGYRDGSGTQVIKSWYWNADGTLTLPAGGVIAEGGGLTGAIKLTPSGGANANQALLIYPTAAADGDHVHLTAGGGSTELYLGNDFHYVKLVDGGNIELRATTANLSSQAAWTFDTTGNIDTIQALGIKVPNGVPSDVAVINSTTGSWEANPRSNLATTGGSGTGLTVNVAETGGYASTIEIATAGTGYTNGDLITVTSGTSNATFIIVIGGRNSWRFGTDGNLTLPQTNMNASPAPTSLPGITWTDGTFQSGRTIVVPQDQSMKLEFTSLMHGSSNLQIRSNGIKTSTQSIILEDGDSHYFSFETSDKQITFSDSYGFILFGTKTRNQTGHFNDIEIKSYGDGTNGNVYISAGGNPTDNRWTFQQNGNLTFPDSTVQSTAWTGSVDRIKNSSAEVIVANTGVVSMPAVSNSQVTISGATKTVKGNPYSVRSAFSSEFEIWKASSADVIAAKITIRLHNDYYTYTELFDVMLVKDGYTPSNVSFSVGPRLKSNDSYPDGIVDVRLSDGNKLTLYYTSVQGDASFYTFDAVEFTKTV